MLVSEHRQSSNVSSRVWYDAEVRIATHHANFSGTKGARARLGDATGRYGKGVNSKYRRSINAGLFDNREVISALCAAAQYSVSQGLTL